MNNAATAATAEITVYVVEDGERTERVYTDAAEAAAYVDLFADDEFVGVTVFVESDEQIGAFDHITHASFPGWQ